MTMGVLRSIDRYGGAEVVIDRSTKGAVRGMPLSLVFPTIQTNPLDRSIDRSTDPSCPTHPAVVTYHDDCRWWKGEKPVVYVCGESTRAEIT